MLNTGLIKKIRTNIAFISSLFSSSGIIDKQSTIQTTLTIT